MEINFIFEGEEKPKKLTRIERVMKLYNQAITDRLQHKVKQAEYLILQLKKRSIEKAQKDLQLMYINQSIKAKYLNKTR